MLNETSIVIAESMNVYFLIVVREVSVFMMDYVVIRGDGCFDSLLRALG